MADLQLRAATGLDVDVDATAPMRERRSRSEDFRVVNAGRILLKSAGRKLHT
jgi:hypothetical protein